MFCVVKAFSDNDIFRAQFRHWSYGCSCYFGSWQLLAVCEGFRDGITDNGCSPAIGRNMGWSACVEVVPERRHRSADDKVLSQCSFGIIF